MFGFLKRFFRRGPSRDRVIDPDEIAEEQWEADFTREDTPGRPPRLRFSLAEEPAYRVRLDKTGGPALCLELKKTGCIAWTEDTFFRYRDLDMKGRIRIEAGGGYAAAGFIFRMVDELTYYMVLVSNRGYFRLDLARNGVPLALAGWTEAPGMEELRPAEAGEAGGAAPDGGAVVEFDLELIAYGDGLLLFINGQWAGNWKDPSLSEGRICFAAAGYEPSGASRSGAAPPPNPRAALLSFQLDSRTVEVGEIHSAREDSAPPENRIRLAETFTALGQANPALVQLRKAWAFRGSRTGKELLLGARLALALEWWDEAEEYIEAALGGGGVEAEARDMKAAFLYTRSRYEELIRWAGGLLAPPAFADPPAIHNLLGHAYFNTGNYPEAAAAYDRAFELNGKNGLAAKNAAAAYETLGRRDLALDRYLKAGRVFLAENNYAELERLPPKLRLLGETNWEARGLIGKVAFALEDWETAEEELGRAEDLRRNTPQPAPETPAPAPGETAPAFSPPPDPALSFLRALLLSRKGKREEAQPLFEEAVRQAPDYPLFRFRRAENRFLIQGDPQDPAFREDLEKALTVKPEEERETYGWVHNLAAQAALSGGRLEEAQSHLDKAAAALGEVPSIRVNRGVALYLNGRLEEALGVLEAGPEEDPEGLMANCAGNLLVRSGRCEEAVSYYERALARAPENSQYRRNQANCLIELGRYGEADDALTAGPETEDPETLELISYVAVKKGEYPRAEAAARAALEIDPDHAPSLLRLGWIRALTARWGEVEEILQRLEGLDMKEDVRRGRDELATRRREALYRTVNCASCGREWRVERNPPPVPALRLYAAPPEDLPAGVCPGCGKAYCVGCRREALDDSGRFTCPDCGRTLKLSDDGLKALVHRWSEENLGATPE